MNQDQGSNANIEQAILAIAQALATGTDYTVRSVPSAFSIYRNAALNSSATPTRVAMDTKEYDYRNETDVTTNQGRFTCTIPGLYQFHGSAGNTAATATDIWCALYVNGVQKKLGNITRSASAPNISHLSCDFPMAVGDYAELFFVGGGGSVMTVGAINTYFQGRFISKI